MSASVFLIFTFTLFNETNKEHAGTENDLKMTLSIKRKGIIVYLYYRHLYKKLMICFGMHFLFICTRAAQIGNARGAGNAIEDDSFKLLHLTKIWL